MFSLFFTSTKKICMCEHELSMILPDEYLSNILQTNMANPLIVITLSEDTSLTVHSMCCFKTMYNH